MITIFSLSASHPCRVLIWHVCSSLGFTAFHNSNGHSNIKTVALVNALAKLHNYCIDWNDGRTKTVCCGDLTSEDMAHISTPDIGYVSMENVEGCKVMLLLQLMNGGHHFDDIPVNNR